jgi:hypothetical protein
MMTIGKAKALGVLTPAEAAALQHAARTIGRGWHASLIIARAENRSYDRLGIPEQWHAGITSAIDRLGLRRFAEVVDG